MPLTEPAERTEKIKKLCDPCVREKKEIKKIMLKTRITELFGIERPIVQGGLMWIAKAELTAAVGNAGGIGFMTALTFPEAELLRTEIRKCREMTDNPFGVNLTF